MIFMPDLSEARRVLALLLLVLVLAPEGAHAQVNAPLDPIENVEIRGSQRIEPSTVYSFLTIREGDRPDQEELDESLKRLFDTGLFADVSLAIEGDRLIVTVVENPIINRISFEGNSRIDDDELFQEVQLRPRVVYTRTRVQGDTERILELYRRSGRFSARVEPKVVLLEQNRVDLIFEIEEGPLTKIRRIRFVGNEIYDDDDLRSELQSKQARWWRFLTSDDTYDPDRVAFDEELLRRFYLSNGYADFRVQSSVAELTPDREDFFITFTIEEGERYRFGNVEIVSDIEDLDIAALDLLITAESGAWYDATEIETTIENLTDGVGDQQYAFVEVRPLIERDREAQEINMTFRIEESPRAFVERVQIGGNTRTIDEVIRREILLVEGDPFSNSRLNRSEQRINDLGFFEEVTVEVEQGSALDQSIIDVQVVEQSTGELSVGAGFSTTDGFLGDFRIRERNLLGQGKDLALAATISSRTQEFDLSYTEPYFLDRDLAAGIDLFHITRDFQDESSFDQRQTGFSVRAGYPLAERLRQRVNYRFVQNELEDVSPLASRFIREQEGKTTTSLVGQEIVFDWRDSRLNPTSGTVLRMSNDIAGLGGDVRFFRTVLGAGYYFSPVYDWVISLTSEGGYIFGLGEDVRINDRFFLGGDTLRGFAVGGVGPRDLETDDALGGNRYVRGSVELTIPIGASDELGIRGHAFTDVGTLGSIDFDDPNLADEESIRWSAGVGVSWRSPLGPIRIDLAAPLLSEDFDETESFRFSFGTRF